MENKCFIKRLVGAIDNDNIAFYNSTIINVGAVGTNEPVSMVFTDSDVKAKIEKGTLKRDGNIVGTAGDVVSLISNTYRVETPFAIRLLDNGKLLNLGAYRPCGFNSITDVAIMADFVNLINLDPSGTNFVGKVEDYVKKATEYGKTSSIIIGGNNITFNGTSSSGQSFKIDFANGITTVKDHKNNDTLLGTYTLSTDTWVYE